MQTRNTFQKAMTFDAVKALQNHPTADEVYSYVSLQYPEISRATVYRNLNFLCDTGVLYRVKLSGSADRFDHQVFPHYHFKCSQCGCISDIVQFPYLENINKQCSEASGNTITDHQIFFDGICKKCLQKD